MTTDRAPSAAARWAAVLAVGVAGGAALQGALVRLLATEGGDLASTLQAAWINAPVPSAVLAVVPLVVAVVSGLVAGRGSRPAPVTAAEVAPAPAPVAAADRTRPALEVLALLQQEGRFLDFLEEDITGYTDETVGSAVRAIHEGCRTALHERMQLAPVLPGEDGAAVTVERGFDPAAIRLTGNVRGEPPYKGVLRHPGWRSERIDLPERTGARDAAVLAPAEVEVL